MQKRPIILRSLLIVATPYVSARDRETERQRERVCERENVVEGTPDIFELEGTDGLLLRV